MKSKIVIGITGTPGTGKTTLAKKLRDLLAHKLKNQDWKVILISQRKLLNLTKSVIGYDESRKVKIVDEHKMRKAFTSYIKNLRDKVIVIVDSHLSHELFPDLCIVTKCDLSELKNRLKKRKYVDKKIEENLQAEIFDVCMQESLEKGIKSYYFWTSKKRIPIGLEITLRELVKEVLSMIKR
ncbi:MAG: AAA family ATPase [Candidatus Woesearchaeota archaeon]